jgi:hypothetical protein
MAGQRRISPTSGGGFGASDSAPCVAALCAASQRPAFCSTIAAALTPALRRAPILHREMRSAKTLGFPGTPGLVALGAVGLDGENTIINEVS